MAKSRFPSDRGLTARMLSTVFLLGLLYAVFITVLFAVHVQVGFIIVLAVGILFAQYFFSDKIAMYSMGGHAVTREQEPQLHGIVDRLVALADMPKPVVAIAQSDIPNAFATGRNQKHAVVCVTTGLLRRLDEPEVEAVLAHELSHVAHRDVAVMTIASFLGLLAGMLTRVFYWSGLFGGFGGGDRRGGNNNSGDNAALFEIGMILVTAVIYAISFILVRMLSRYRELAADRSGAILIGQPQLLASALVKVSGEIARSRLATFAPQSTSTRSTSPPRSHRARASPRCSRRTRACKNASTRWPSWTPRCAVSTRDDTDRRHVPHGTVLTVGFLDSLLGRTKPAQANLDHLFGLPGAQITLEASEGLVPSGKAGVCFKPASGQAFADTEKELNDLLMLDEAGESSPTRAGLTGDADEFGYRWIVVESSDFNALVTRVHLVNSTLQDHNWGPQLLCSVFGFHPGTTAATGSLAPPEHVFLVYLYKRGSFYPFVPTTGEHRNNEAELRLKAELSEDLSFEADLDRWFPLWKLPLT